ncbi:MAG: hypothetical protein KGM24_00390 [Elusimicrobia bacterium]|nr:hypothetical protein [Elusimicrobiota bacterium]
MVKKMTPVGQPQDVASKPSLRKARLEVSIDFPHEGDVVKPGHYAIRLTALSATQAQVRVGESDWLDCRETSGHFWHDWAPQSGPTTLRARARIGKGRWTSVAERSCIVVG